MKIYGISDLHLSFDSNKPMGVFGELWEDHYIKIEKNWRDKITDNDLVLIAGDISWGMKIDEALKDLEFIHRLPGKKTIIKGNHDYWWASISKLNSLYEDIYFIQNTHYKWQDYAICGTRGWISLDGEEHNEAVYKRELLRLEMSLESAVKEGINKKIVMMHYPPITKYNKCKEFLDILEKYKVEKVIYGHIHSSSKNICFNGIYNEIEYKCTSADIINFDPIRIL
ncbi:metallophosphoesterase [Clostridium cylindrosporum]|uniref:Metallophosphoesterase n=1 Tax=Clostridium cylindrosporum DSM 605 TaxID=1121307 RepID=A0A0J8D4W1_CLOCY|nr:metallophosphoesterase [Clostridium cylindrosporum]KMT20857.1 metallophosphoesterase [Clostridium cylindrosporum DSM 605]